jgi:Rv0623-like transcription factor
VADSNKVETVLSAGSRSLHDGRNLVWRIHVALNIENDEVERLAAEEARLTGESKTKACEVPELVQSM